MPLLCNFQTPKQTLQQLPAHFLMRQADVKCGQQRSDKLVIMTGKIKEGLKDGGNGREVGTLVVI